MTKEDVYDNQYHHSPQTERQKALKAMDEWAKLKAIEFADWGFKDDNPFVEGSNGKWIQECGNSTSWTTEQLYNQFIENQNK